MRSDTLDFGAGSIIVPNAGYLRDANDLFLVRPPSLSPSLGQGPCRFADLAPKIDHVDVCITVMRAKNA